MSQPDICRNFTSVSGRVSVYQAGLRMDCPKLQGSLPHSGDQQICRGMPHNVAVDVNGGKGGRNDPGLCGIVKAAEPHILRYGDAQLFKYTHGVHSHIIIRADKYIWH